MLPFDVLIVDPLRKEFDSLSSNEFFIDSLFIELLGDETESKRLEFIFSARANRRFLNCSILQITSLTHSSGI